MENGKTTRDIIHLHSRALARRSFRRQGIENEGSWPCILNKLNTLKVPGYHGAHFPQRGSIWKLTFEMERMAGTQCHKDRSFAINLISQSDRLQTEFNPNKSGPFKVMLCSVFGMSYVCLFDTTVVNKTGGTLSLLLYDQFNSIKWQRAICLSHHTF